MQTSLLTLACLCLLWICVLVSGRPNPVPNDELGDRDLEMYEKTHDKLNHRVKRHRRIMGPEDPDDLDVWDELSEHFSGIRRRVRDVHSHRPNIFQKYIDQAQFSGYEDSRGE